jgi:hypothetical protein
MDFVCRSVRLPSAQESWWPDGAHMSDMSCTANFNFGIEKIIRDYQCGFECDRSTAYHMF